MLKETLVRLLKPPRFTCKKSMVHDYLEPHNDEMGVPWIESFI